MAGRVALVASMDEARAFVTGQLIFVLFLQVVCLFSAPTTRGLVKGRVELAVRLFGGFYSRGFASGYAGAVGSGTGRGVDGCRLVEAGLSSAHSSRPAQFLTPRFSCEVSAYVVPVRSILTVLRG